MTRPDDELPLSKVKPVAEDVGSELADHLARRTESLIQEGMEPAAARAEAERAFGNVQNVAAECREITVRTRRSRRRTERWDALVQDVTFGLRLLRRSPGFALTAIITLALGIGANTAIFSVIDSLILRPLPYDHANQIVDVVELHKKGWANLSWPNFADLREQSTTFDGMAAYGQTRATILGSNEPIRIGAAMVSADFFQIMRMRPALGRLPGVSDHQLGALPVAVVSQRFWREHLGENNDLTAARLRGEFPFQVVGVAAPGFDFPAGTDIWYPLELLQQGKSRTAHNWSVIGRLKPGVDATAGKRDLDLVLHRLATTVGNDFDAVGAKVTPLQDDLTGSLRKPLLLLLGASGLLLLTACTNLASSLLARGAARGQELAVRVAIGAGRTRLLRQCLTESMVISVLGCVAGIGVAELVLKGLVHLAPPSLQSIGAAALDLRVLAFTLVVGLATTFLFGLLPALRMSSVQPAGLMRGGTRGSGHVRRSTWSTLVMIEVALAVVLLIGSGLLLRSFAAVLAVDIGFRPDQVLIASIDLPELTYPNVSQAVDFHDRALEAIKAIPGVAAVGVTNVLPIAGYNPSGGIQVEGKPAISPIYPITGYAAYRLASPGYFDAMGIRIVKGRSFVETDVVTVPSVAVVNEAFVKANWPGEDPIGKHFRIGGMDPVESPAWSTVVGVAHDVPSDGLGTEVRPVYYFSYRQLPFRSRWLTAVVRTSGPESAMAPAVRAAITRIDPSVPLEFSAMSDHVSQSIADRRFTMVLLACFSGIAYLLAAVGIYGVVSYSVSQRTREIGIRMALGAAPRKVRWMVQRGALVVVLGGVATGVVGAVLGTRILESMLFGVTATDPASFGLVAALLIATAWAASLIPALRGSRVDPVVAIRAE